MCIYYVTFLKLLTVKKVWLNIFVFCFSDDITLESFEKVKHINFIIHRLKSIIIYYYFFKLFLSLITVQWCGSEYEKPFWIGVCTIEKGFLMILEFLRIIFLGRGDYTVWFEFGKILSGWSIISIVLAVFFSLDWLMLIFRFHCALLDSSNFNLFSKFLNCYF
jgi:hypothetical protein